MLGFTSAVLSALTTDSNALFTMANLKPTKHIHSAHAHSIS